MTDSTTRTITLLDYANDREHVVLFWASTGNPMGSHTPLGQPDLDFADRNGLLELSGTVDANGEWYWDGDGDPTDDLNNSIISLSAYTNNQRWAAIVEEFETEG